MKRQREQAKRERQQKKIEKRAQRKDKEGTEEEFGPVVREGVFLDE
ncbi:MAG TPA: hypothetical protein VF111_06690 [Thermoanaerobaculia bacterium]